MSQPEYNWNTGEVESDEPSPAEEQARDNPLEQCGTCGSNVYYCIDCYNSFCGGDGGCTCPEEA
jgi:hypothetical protein